MAGFLEERQEQQGHQEHREPRAMEGDLRRDEQFERARAAYFSSPIHPFVPAPGQSPRMLFSEMARASGPLRNLAELYQLWEEMCRASNQAVWLTAAGAYIPFGLGGVMRALLDSHYIDVLVTTPAQLTHDLTEVRGYHHFQSREDVDDNELQRLDVLRYWNTVSDERDLETNGDTVFAFLETLALDRPYTPSELFYRLGLWLDAGNHKRRDGMLTSAARAGIPIFCPSPADGDIICDMGHYRKRTGRRVLIDPLREALDMVAVNAAIEDAGGRAGLIGLGGGAPRNYGQQAMACAYMLDRKDLKKYNYGLRISLDPVQTGGLSGSTISEAKTWKKYAPDTQIAEYFGEFMVPLVHLTQALLDAFDGKPRQPALTVRYAEDGRMLATVKGNEIDLQAAYNYQ